MLQRVNCSRMCGVVLQYSQSYSMIASNKNTISTPTHPFRKSSIVVAFVVVSQDIYVGFRIHKKYLSTSRRRTYTVQIFMSCRERLLWVFLILQSTVCINIINNNTIHQRLETPVDCWTKILSVNTITTYCCTVLCSQFAVVGA